MNTLIEEKDVGVLSLSLLLEQAYIEHLVVNNDTALYVREKGMFPFWVKFYAKARFVLFESYINIRPEVEPLERLQLCNRINTTLFLPSATVQTVERENEPEQIRLVTNHVLQFRDGLLPAHFIQICRDFSEGMFRIQSEFDPHGATLLHLEV